MKLDRVSEGFGLYEVLYTGRKILRRENILPNVLPNLAFLRVLSIAIETNTHRVG